MPLFDNRESYLFDYTHSDHSPLAAFLSSALDISIGLLFNQRQRNLSAEPTDWKNNNNLTLLPSSCYDKSPSPAGPITPTVSQLLLHPKLFLLLYPFSAVGTVEGTPANIGHHPNHLLFQGPESEVHFRKVGHHFKTSIQVGFFFYRRRVVKRSVGFFSG